MVAFGLTSKLIHYPVPRAVLTVFYAAGFSPLNSGAK